MEICCYILYSKKRVKFYIGACQENLALRIEKHNSGFYGKDTFTSAAQDWDLYLRIDVLEFSHAIRIERKIKSMKSTAYIKNLKLYTELVAKIKAETACN